MAIDETRGTTEPDDGDAAEKPTTGTPEPEKSPDAASAADENVTKLNMEWKAKAERVNALEAEVEALKTRIPQPPAAEGTDEDDELSPSEIANLKAAELAGNWGATAILKTDRALKKVRQEREAEQVSSYVREQERQIPADKLEAARKEYEANRHLYGSPLVAHRALEREDLSRENERLRKQNELLSRGLDPDVAGAVTTHGREGGAQTRQSKLTEEQFDREAAHILKTQGALKEMKYRQENAARIG